MFWIVAYGREVRLHKFFRYELTRSVGIFKRNCVGCVARFSVPLPYSSLKYAILTSLFMTRLRYFEGLINNDENRV